VPTVPRTLAQNSAHNQVASDPSSAIDPGTSTQVGERSLLVLPDGSKVTLNTASAVRADYSGMIAA